jgi:heterodisulfide reductase subunit C
MTMPSELKWNDTAFCREVERRSGAPVSACFQCHKCSTGCPVGEEMDVMSSQIMRLIHLGADQEVLESRGIWTCASCEACTTRCPMGIDIAGVMDTLRMMAIEQKVAIPDAKGDAWNRSFLNSVRRHGRVFEMGALIAYKLRSRDFFSDVDKGPKMLAKKKLALMPKNSGAVGEVKAIFKRAEGEEKQR